MRNLHRDQSGASAIEFGLVAPFLVFALLATADVGFALFERMTIDHILRSGAQAAMTDPGEEAVRQVLEATAARNFGSAGDSSLGAALSLSTVRYHACAQAPGTAVANTTTCSGASTSIYYQLSATRTYEGRILPAIAFAPSVRVQAR